MAREENDIDTLVAVEADTHSLQKQVEDMEFRRMFSNPLDKNSCFIDIQAGAGGTEAQDWASMLLRQYLRYCERKGFKTEILEQSDGDVAGIKTATIKVDGDHAYGFLRTETGVHRLVRKSPFDSANGRHTSFSSLFVYPEVDESVEIDINPADVLSIAAQFAVSDSENINAADTPSIAAQFAVSDTENLTAADSSTQTSSFGFTDTENIGVADSESIAAQFATTQTENFNPEDTYATYFALGEDRVEPFTMADSSTQQSNFNQSINSEVEGFFLRPGRERI